MCRGLNIVYTYIAERHHHNNDCHHQLLLYVLFIFISLCKYVEEFIHKKTFLVNSINFLNGD
jgi:hypothetical protein